MTDLTVLSLNQLLKLKQKNTDNVYNYQKQIKYFNKLDKLYTYLIYKKCDHNWIKSDFDYGLYNKPPKICSKCNLERDNYISLT